MAMTTRIAACQVPEIREDVATAMSWIERYAMQAEKQQVALLCFPECFLQGYLTDEKQAGRHAMDLASDAFAALLQRLAHFQPMLVFGLIESDNGALFNTAVVVRRGRLVGRYRKCHLLDGERTFQRGTSHPIFGVAGLKFGINICSDTQVPEAATALAMQGAALIVCPANNMMRRDKAEQWKHRHHATRAERVREAGVWLISSDVTGERDGRISYGPTAIIDPTGQVISQVPLGEVGMVVADIGRTR